MHMRSSNVPCIFAYFIFMQTDKRWYITVLQLSQQLSDNYMTEICQKCDIMKINIINGTKKRLTACVSSVRTTLTPFARLTRGTSAISLFSVTS